jgi:hypothetical protein
MGKGSEAYTLFLKLLPKIEATCLGNNILTLIAYEEAFWCAKQQCVQEDKIVYAKRLMQLSNSHH